MDAPPPILKEVEREYERALVLPSRTTPRQWILMPVGVLGAGKTTVTKPLAEHFGLIRLSTDDVRRRLKERGYSYEGCRDIIHSLVRKYLSAGYSLALDANTGSVHALPYNIRMVEEFPHVRQVFIHIDPPEEYIVNKLRAYPHTWLFADGEQAIARYHENKAAFTVPDLPFVYRFDPSREDFGEQLKEGVAAIQAAIGA